MHSSGPDPLFTRRRFMQAAGAATALGASPLARAAFTGAPPVGPNDRINIGVIGWGMMGPANTKSFLGFDDCRVVAACDIHKGHLQKAVDTVNQKYGNQD